MPKITNETSVLKSFPLNTKEDAELEYIGNNPTESLVIVKHGSPSEKISWSYHPEYELHYIKESSGYIFVGDYIGNFFPGNITLIGSNLPHNWITTSQEVVPERDFAVLFTKEMMEGAMRLFPELGAIAEMINDSRYGLEFEGNILKDFSALLGKLDAATGLKRLGVFWEILALLADGGKYRKLSSQNYGPSLSRKTSTRINMVTDYIMENYAKDIYEKDVAEHINMSVVSFSVFFKKNTGNTFKQYINALRISKACQLLLNTDSSVTGIGYDVGYNNMACFNRNFLKNKSITPFEYRKRAKHLIKKKSAGSDA